MRTDPSPITARLVLGRALPRAGRTILLLLRLILPISFGVALLRWTGVLEKIGEVFAPVMGLFRLPGEAAVAFVSGALAGIYAMVGAMAVLPLNPAEVTVLCAIALVAHNLIVESTVQQKAGTPWWWMLAVRLGSGAVVGALVAWSIAALEGAGLPALWLRIVPVASEAPATAPAAMSAGEFLARWARDAFGVIVKLVTLVTAMMVGTEWIRASGLMQRLERACLPLLRFFGLSERLAYPWLTAQILGVAFGAGLLIEEMRDRASYPPRAVRDLHTSIGVSHSVFEDTILLVSLGASLFWIMVPRLLWAALVVRVLRPLPFGLHSSTGIVPGSSGARGGA